jgi:histidyl-tRNA synthetase
MNDEVTNGPSKRRMKKQKAFKPKARTPRGFRDMAGEELRLQTHMLETISKVYEAYGFEALDTSAFEYADALGKFLPDDDRPNEGVFALEDDDGQWMSLRYDLTAPLARHVAEHYDRLPKPLRRYQFGAVWRNEKPGPGRYRQFMQIDADTVGAANQAADAEICMMAADCMEALGIARGDYVVRINNRKIMDGLLAAIGLDPQADDFENRRLTILRAMDKYDRLGLEGVKALLGEGRKDESGDFTKGAGLDTAQIDKVAQMVSISADDRTGALKAMAELVGDTEAGKAGLDELVSMAAIFTALGYDADRLAIDPAVVRGLGYYTGPVYEIELTFEAEDESGELARFGSVGGGGRYDDLVKRFKGIEIPATGISIGVSRLAAALTLLGKNTAAAAAPLVVVTVMDKETRPELMALVSDLRAAGIRAEMYMGDSAMKAQLRYADARGARLVVIEGEDERAQGVVTLKDLQLGAEKSAEIEDNAEWRASEHAQKQVSRADLVSEIQKIIS